MANPLGFWELSNIPIVNKEILASPKKYNVSLRRPVAVNF